jgi:polar amino acid transport system substrate-binding protein
MVAREGFLAASEAGAQDETARAELAPTGKVRIALVEAPNPGVFFVGRGPDGAPEGVTHDLGRDLAKTLGVEPEFKVFPNSGEATEATRTGAVDLAFMPVDATRRELLAFGPAYYDLESTYLVTAASGVTDVKEVDREGFRVLGIAGTTTIRASARTLTKTQPQPVASVGEAVAMMKDSRADAFALSRDSLAPIRPHVPGSRIVTGGFQQTQVALAVPKERPAALAFATAWLTRAKGQGTVRRIFDAHGLRDEKVAE